MDDSIQTNKLVQEKIAIKGKSSIDQIACKR